jgi:hypothetical protein
MEAAPMRVLQSASRSVTLVALALALGCSNDSTAPDAPFDPTGTSADLAAIDESFDAPAMDAYAAASAQISAVVGGSAALAVRAVPSAAIASGGKTGALRYAASLAREYRTTGLRPSFSAAGIPAEYLGTTFVYDVETDGYVASDLAGAPAAGVRFLLYAVNPVTTLPIEPLVEIGYADLTVSETETSYTARAIVVSEGVTYLDYTVAALGGTSAAAVTISGYATNGNDRVNFDLETSLTSSEEDGLGFAIDYLLVVPTRGGFRLDIEATQTGIFTEVAITTLDLEARGDHGTVTIQGTEENGVGSFEVEVNGDLFATITVSGDAPPVIAGAGGQPLSQAEQALMLAIWAMFAEGFDFFEDLTDPIG